MATAAEKISTPSLPSVSIDELARATKDWCEESILGQGGYGRVYRGVWKHTPVAIKRLRFLPSPEQTDKESRSAIKQLWNELQSLNRYRHPNILPLYAFCIDEKRPCLVYEYVEGGSLYSRLSGKQGPPLSLSARFYIVKGTARGLLFLHTVIGDKPLIHSDIKPANILLDAMNVPKIGDFGLSREAISNEPFKISTVVGTRPYIPHEFIHYNFLSTKVDIFSFGVVLFELITGLMAYDSENRVGKNMYLYNHIKQCADHKELSQFAGMIHDLFSKSDKTFKLYRFLFKLGSQCVSDDAEKRPEMTYIFKYLKKLDGGKD